MPSCYDDGQRREPAERPDLLFLIFCFSLNSVYWSVESAKDVSRKFSADPSTRILRSEPHFFSPIRLLKFQIVVVNNFDILVTKHDVHISTYVWDR